MTIFASVNVEAVVIFAIVLAITLGITYWASQRVTGAPTFSPPGARSPAFRTASRSRGDYLSARRSSASPA